MATPSIPANEQRLPPHSLEAEQALLCALLLDNPAWDHIADMVKEEDFYRDDHRRIFHHITALIDENKPADVVTLHERIERHGDEQRAGGLPYLAEIINAAPSSVNIRHYAHIIREYAILRHLVSVGERIAELALNAGGQSATQILDKAESEIFVIAEQGKGRTSEHFQNISELNKEVFDRISALAAAGSPNVTGVASGFDLLDKETAGMQPGDLIIVAGRPSMGKTALALNIAENVSFHQGLPVAVFSMEMSASQLAMRMLSSFARIDQQKVRKGRLTDEDWSRLTDGVSRMSRTPLFIDEAPNLNPLELRARARRLAKKCGQLGLIVVDYLQLMSASRGRDQNRVAEITEISRSLKGLAKELKVPVMALSQLNRELERRTENKRPMMSDLRESGAIEQDADVILFIYRDEVYNPDSADKGVAEIIIGKQRNGPIGKLKLAFINHLTRFENLAHPGIEEHRSDDTPKRNIPGAMADGHTKPKRPNLHR